MVRYGVAFKSLNLAPMGFVTRIVLPCFAAALCLSVLIVLFPPPSVGLIGTYALAAVIAAMGTGIGVLWPMIAWDRRRMQIDHILPIFMTHLGVLTTTNLARTDLMRILAQRREYKAVASECGKIYRLVTNWNMSLPQAARFVAGTTPSRIFADFLERFAYAIETGQDLPAFMKNEQSVVMKEYSSVYETAIYMVESWKEIYLSLMMSGVFFVIFAIMAPILAAIEVTAVVIGIVGFFVIIEAFLLLVLKMRVPVDRLWHRLEIRSDEQSRIRVLVTASLLVSAVLLVAAFVVPTNAPLGFLMSGAITPMAAAGWYARRTESKVKRREDNYSGFVRSLGAGTASKGGSMRDVLKRIEAQNFGPLTEQVHNLFARLSWRIDDALAWRRFSAETGSHLVASFTDMIVQGVKAGGAPNRIGEIVSSNVVRILNLRKSRYTTAGTFRSMLLGLTLSMAFVLFLGVGILDALSRLFGDVTTQTLEGVATFSLAFDFPTQMVSQVLFALVLYHCLMAALMLKIVDGGGYPAGFGAFVLLVWVGLGVASLTAEIVPRMVNLGGS